MPQSELSIQFKGCGRTAHLCSQPERHPHVKLLSGSDGIFLVTFTERAKSYCLRPFQAFK